MDVLSRFSRVVPMRSKRAPDAAKPFKMMIGKVQLQTLVQQRGRIRRSIQKVLQ